MARGGNDKPRINNPTTTQHDNHNLSTYTSTFTTVTTSSQQSGVTGICSIRNDFRGSGVVHCSGTVGSFNNYGKGSQNFSDAVISSGSAENSSSGTGPVAMRNTCSGTIGSFNNCGKGSQDFKDAKINSGHNSGQARGASSNQHNASDNHSSATPSSIACYPASQITGTLNSFNNHGKGS